MKEITVKYFDGVDVCIETVKCHRFEYKSSMIRAIDENGNTIMTWFNASKLTAGTDDAMCRSFTKRKYKS